MLSSVSHSPVVQQSPRARPGQRDLHNDQIVEQDFYNDHDCKSNGGRTRTTKTQHEQPREL